MVNMVLGKRGHDYRLEEETNTMQSGNSMEMRNSLCPDTKCPLALI